jgi:hypothetical protein
VLCRAGCGAALVGAVKNGTAVDTVLTFSAATTLGDGGGVAP